MTNQAEALKGAEAAPSLRGRLRSQPISRVAIAIGISLVVVLGGMLRLVSLLNSDSTPIPTKAEPLKGAAVASPVQGLPVPAQAGGQTGTVRSIYIVPAGFVAVNAWYSHHLHAGDPWHGWSWVTLTTCTAYDAGVATLWEWQRGGQTLTLEISKSLPNPRFAAVTISTQSESQPSC
jgi:hypothetical protein